ncbi:YceI family protein [Hwangdonia lutea]|uniref:YceI family protein n=1 Tax=Hwangdonia lutea TaxID=3075823 RepID=A0AA97HR69_9FLAO|nr:YceI family protein [Hwangdonia sp. SCSIO 19198]WOD44282.1 YceI family protein [Hwangdonia sp. SCSIO 19198]
MKNIFCILFLIGFGLSAQTKYITKTGMVNFEASVPTFEKVKATHNLVTAIINTDNGEFAALALVKGFRFKNALMEEHFNENYAESDTFPKATFKGTIKDFDITDLKTETLPYTLKGELTFHGKTKHFNALNISILKDNNKIILSGHFKAKASDFDIEIPKIVRNKISETIAVSFEFNMKKKE